MYKNELKLDLKERAYLGMGYLYFLEVCLAGGGQLDRRPRVTLFASGDGEVVDAVPSALLQLSLHVSWRHPHVQHVDWKRKRKHPII